eukprot:CAMPEP_0197443184 /NCGR_PEP_ID=MMETSP1175-20131217/8998_1 /TAXON_ID=1003142 /ORGANISM="Triceratium dubium, Strain CCMP147" /LENGTH=140 /DNA_ID=CAMNT_0042973781 /DNA_START=17 /DNA_END=439 /DNA_ORIENTATION=+
MKKFSKVLLGALLASNASVSSAVHYEKPPCGSDEKAVQLQGVDGVFCSPQCNPGCPTDVPDGVSAIPQCVLQSPDGSKYCALLCRASDNDGTGGGGDCGSDMKCEPIPHAKGIGLCLYSFPFHGLRFSAMPDEVLFEVAE